MATAVMPVTTTRCSSMSGRHFDRVGEIRGTRRARWTDGQNFDEEFSDEVRSFRSLRTCCSHYDALERSDHSARYPESSRGKGRQPLLDLSRAPWNQHVIGVSHSCGAA